jgi:flagellar basal-body rod protein FlgC
MPDGLFGPLAASASAMGAERLRMSVASENLAHAGDSERRANGLPYARQRVTFSSVLDRLGNDTGTVAAQVVPSPRYTQHYEPDHPNADPASGIVTESHIDPILELTDLLVASRAYDANSDAAKGLMKIHDAALRLGDLG